MNLTEFVRDVAFTKGEWEVLALASDGARPLMRFALALDEEDDLRRPPEVRLLPGQRPVDRERVVDALVRAGVRHPGLRNEDLRMLHAAARTGGYVELFADLNALKNGLVQQVVRSLGRLVGRVVVSSSSIDVLHEYQALARHRDDGSRKYLASWEMGRALQALDELRSDVPVHIHQLPVGSARYVRRVKADSPPTPPTNGDDQEDPQLTFISEDRQMIGAYWDYATSTNPRLPFYLVTSDFALAHVCAAERVPFLFARAPREFWKADNNAPTPPKTIWFDPYALALRSCVTHAILWELCLVYGQLNVVRRDPPDSGFGLTYEPRNQVPGCGQDLAHGGVITVPLTKPTKGDASARARSKERHVTGGTDKDPAKLKLSLQTLVTVLPTHVSQRIPLPDPSFSDELLGQIRNIGQQTGLYLVENGEVTAGPRLGDLLTCLKDGDYVGVNEIFGQQPAYRKVLDQARSTNTFPSSKIGGTATGWAIMLGAAYKTTSGVRFGLASITDEQFERAVKRAHAEGGGGQAAVPLFEVLDRVCQAIQISPIRFEGLLNKCVGQRGLLSYEVQRASVQGTIPPQPLIVAPRTRAPDSYIETFEPAKGLRIAGKLAQSLVLRAGGG